MSENLKLIGQKLEHLARMRTYLDYSTRKMQGPLEKIHGEGMDALTPEEHETVAAFRTRLADMQEHLGKTMRSVAIEEEVNVDRFGSVLAFMEKMTDGPFVGTEAIFAEQDGEKRVIVLLELLGKTNKIRVDRDWVARAA